jgi:hypothetical protein
VPESSTRERREWARSGTEQRMAHQRNPGYSLTDCRLVAVAAGDRPLQWFVERPSVRPQ